MSNRQAAAHGRVILGGIPGILGGDEIHHAIRHGDKLHTNHGKDIRGRVAVTGSALGKAGSTGWLKRENMDE